MSPGVLKAKLPDGTWTPIAGPGPAGSPGEDGPAGPTGPPGPPSGAMRVVFESLIGTIATHATANTMSNCITGTASIRVDRKYMIYAGCRAIQDPGAIVPLVQWKVVVGNQLEGYDVISAPDSGLFGAWGQMWVKDGSELASADGDVTVSLACQLNASSKTLYAPRLYIFEIDNDPPPEAGPTGPAGPPGGVTMIDGLLDVDTTTTAPTAGSALVWDGAGQWVPGAAGGDYLPLTGGVVDGPVEIVNDYLTMTGDGYGILLHGDGRIYKRAGGGITIRRHADLAVQTESTDGTQRWDMLDKGNILSTSYSVTWANSFTGTFAFRVSPAGVSAYGTNISRGVATAVSTQVKMMSYPSGVPAPPGTTGCIVVIGDETNQAGGLGIASIEFRTDGVFLRCWNTGMNNSNHRIYGCHAAWMK